MKTSQKRMKIILNESQVKRLLDSIKKESVLDKFELKSNTSKNQLFLINDKIIKLL